MMPTVQRTRAQDFIRSEFAPVIAGNRAGMRPIDSLDIVVKNCMTGIKNGRVAQPRMGAQEQVTHYAREFQRQERRENKLELARDLEWLVDQFDRDSPILDRYYPMGNGKDKTLRYWTQEDFKIARITREANLETQRIATQKFSEIVDRVLQRMIEQNANSVEEMHPTT